MDRSLLAQKKCSVTQHLEIYKAGKKEYAELSRFHYRCVSLSPYVAVYAIRDRRAYGQEHGRVIGVVVYTMPVPSLQLRTIATDGRYYCPGDRVGTLRLINDNIRCISRVIIEPRYRGLGLAAWLVRETMFLLNVPVIESLAVMGRFNGFFNKAGFTSYDAPIPERCVRLTEALQMVSIDESMFVDPTAVHTYLSTLADERGVFIETQIKRFLQAYGKRAVMEAGIERTRYVLSKLTDRPVYYIWFNDKEKPQCRPGK
ncbi:MAG: hypothetical protein KAS23_04845 [Anaerohalosphaera sp.]|nr:hypothetical protein [Anaerohalosphaera sp.]